MNYLLFIVSSVFLPYVISFTQNNIQNVLKYKNLLPQENYNNFIKKIETHEISKVYISKTLDNVISERENSEGSINDYTITAINPFITNSIVEKTTKNDVETSFIEINDPFSVDSLPFKLLGALDNYVFPFLFLTFAISLFRGMSNNNGMPPGLSMNNFKKINEDKINMVNANISLKSFAGSDEIFQECTEVVSYLKNSTTYKEAGAEIPRGILLEGPPGTGKTLLAKAIASEAEANFISIAASEFVEVFVGVGASKIRSLFKQARDNKPCIIFIDEIDAVGRQRGAGINMANDEREQTLNQLLAEMDGFTNNEGILIIAATNRKDVLDSALLRPGRFDRIINVPLPDRNSRKDIFKVHSKNKKLSPNINFEFIAELTNGFSGAQIKNLLNEAAIYAVRRGDVMISENDLLNALDKLIVGLVKKNDTRSVESKRRIAIHETGHALLTLVFKEYYELKKVTIQSTYNGAGGYTIFNEYQNITESGLYTKDVLKKRLIIGMGGKAAESIFYGDDHVSVGATQDLKQTNSLAQRMIGNYGMGKDLEVFYNENTDNDRNPFLGRSFGSGDKYSDKLKQTYDKESLELVIEAYNEAKRLLLENREKMDIMIDILMKKNTIQGNEINEFLL